MKEEQKQALVKRLSRTFAEKGVTDLSGCGIDIISNNEDVNDAIASGLYGYTTVTKKTELPKGVAPFSVAKPTPQQIAEKYSSKSAKVKEETLIVEDVEPTYVKEETLIVEDAEPTYVTDETLVVEDVAPQLTGDYPNEIWMAEETSTEIPSDPTIAATTAAADTVEEIEEESEKKDEYLLEVKNLKKYFAVKKNLVGKTTAFLRAVDNVSFALKKGKTLGIVGESGCGKTTMGRTILRLHEASGGEVWFNGQEVSKISNREFDKLRPNMQMIFQDPYASLSPRLTVGAIIGEAALQHGLIKKENYREYVLEIMKMCGLQPHYYDRYPHEFSGGQRQRICIARALALKPQLVVCDEPVSALDVSIQAQIINMLKELQKELGLTYVFISHDLSVVKHISDEVGVMYLGSMVEYGSKESIFKNTLHPYTKALFSAVPVPNPHVKMNRVILTGDIPSPVNPPKGCKFHTRCDKCMEICKSIPPKYREVEDGHFCACHLYASEEERAEMEAGLASKRKKKNKK